MVNADWQAVFVREPQVVKENLGLRAGVVKDERRLVLLDLFQHCGNGIGRAAAGPGRSFFCAQHCDVRGRAGVGQQNFTGIWVPRQQVRDLFRVVDGCGQSDALQVGAERLQTRQRKHQLIAPFAFRQRVDFVDNDPLEPFEGMGRVFIACQKGEALWCGEQDMRRVRALPLFLKVRGVAGTIFDPDIQTHVLDRGSQVAFDVRCQRLQWRHIKRVHAVAGCFAEIHQRRQKPSQGFAAPGGRDQQHGRCIRPVQNILLVGMQCPPARVKPFPKPCRQGGHVASAFGLGAEKPIEQTDDFGGVCVAEGIVDRLAVTPGSHKAIVAQPCQHLADRRLTHFQQAFQFADGFFTTAKMAQNHQAALMCEGFQISGRGLGILRHFRCGHRGFLHVQEQRPQVFCS